MVTNHLSFCKNLCLFLTEKQPPAHVKLDDTHCCCRAKAIAPPGFGDGLTAAAPRDGNTVDDPQHHA